MLPTRRALLRASPAALIGVGLRASPLFEGGAQLVFVLVVTLVGLVGLGVWRWLYFKIR